MVANVTKFKVIIGIMEIKRDEYVERLFSKSWNGKVKIITGLRRSGKSFLLRRLYKNELINRGESMDSFIEIDLESAEDARFRNPLVLLDYVKSKTCDHNRRYYVFIDEIQRSYKVKNEGVDESKVAEEDRDLLYITFYDVLSSMMKLENVDVYVTGSNSRMLSSDIVSHFRDRGSEIKVYPLCFREFYDYTGMDKSDALEEYLTHGGMPTAVFEKGESEKRMYLSGLHINVYMKDIMERNNLKNDVILDALTDTLYSSVGSLTNPHKLASTTCSVLGQRVSDSTIKRYLEILEDSYLINGAKRYDVKGRKYFSSIQKYYATDLGLRNARLNFRQQERSHLMENLIYNELIIRGYSVDVGVVEVSVSSDGKRKQRQYEIDFVVNTGNDKVYIQSALNIDTEEKKRQETFSLLHSNDFFRKIVVLGGNERRWTDESGIEYIGVISFLLQEKML